MQHQTNAIHAAHATLQAANPGLAPCVTPVESLSGGVGKTVVGGKGYWKQVQYK